MQSQQNALSATEVGARLERARAIMGLPTQKAMAERLGANVNQYNNWARGAQMIPVTFAAKLCTYGFSLDYIYRGDLSNLPVRIVALLEERPDTGQLSHAAS